MSSSIRNDFFFLGIVDAIILLFLFFLFRLFVRFIGKTKPKISYLSKEKILIFQVSLYFSAKIVRLLPP